MNKQVLQTSVMFAVLFGATLTNASAQESPGLEGPWIANVTVHNCDTGDVIRTVRELAMFGHDGSFTQAGATITGSANPRSSGVGAWRHATGNTYNATFQFLGLTPSGTFFNMALATRVITLQDDHWTSQDKLSFYDVTGNWLGTVCSSVAATRAPLP